MGAVVQMSAKVQLEFVRVPPEAQWRNAEKGGRDDSSSQYRPILGAVRSLFRRFDIDSTLGRSGTNRATRRPHRRYQSQEGPSTPLVPPLLLIFSSTRRGNGD